VAVSGEQHRLLYRIAHAYYEDGLTQAECAKRFGLSRPSVSRQLKRARENGIITITLTPPPRSAAHLERALELAYGLQEVVLVAVTDPDDHARTVRELGPFAAEALLRCVSGDEVIATAWGSSILAMVEALPYRSWPNVTIVQMLGGLGPVEAVEHSAVLTQHIAQKLGAGLRLLPAPGIVATREMAQALRSDGQVATVLETAAQADIMVVGLGVPSPQSLLLRTGTILSQKDLDTLEDACAVGDIALRYLDVDGATLQLELNDRLIGISIEQIRRSPRVIGIAGGTTKKNIIRAALRGGILDVLVTDVGTAEALLAELDDRKGVAPHAECIEV
jgi:DNA-binding transcriptional regulator LsrR (DeoR family)